MTVNSIKLTLTTYANAYTEPNPSTRCKKARLRVTIEVNQQGPVSFKLWAQRGNGAIGSEEITRVAHHDDGYFRAVYERWVEVDETTRVQFNARDLINDTFNKETGWKDIILHCTGVGGGGLAAPTEDRHDGLPGGRPKPRVNPAVGGGPRGLTAEPNPTHAPQGASSDNPKTARSVCRGGAIRNGRCVCPRDETRKTIGNRQFQCVAIAKPPEKKAPARTNPRPKVEVVCEGGRISKGTCRCGSGRKLVRVGSAAFACQPTRAVRSNAKPSGKATEPSRVRSKRDRPLRSNGRPPR